MRSQLVFLAAVHGGSGDLTGPATAAFDDLESRWFERTIPCFRCRTFSCSRVWNFLGGRHFLPRGSPFLPAHGLHPPTLDWDGAIPEASRFLSVPSSTLTKSIGLGGTLPPVSQRSRLNWARWHMPVNTELWRIGSSRLAWAT